PRALTRVRTRRWMNGLTALSLALGVTLVAAGVVVAAASRMRALRLLVPTLSTLTRGPADWLYFSLQYLLASAALGSLLFRARRAPVDERRRAELLVWGLVAGV